MLRKNKNRNNKDLNFKIKLIEKIDTLELQNKHLNNKIKSLEQRIIDLEITRKVGF